MCNPLGPKQKLGNLPSNFMQNGGTLFDKSHSFSFHPWHHWDNASNVLLSAFYSHLRTFLYCFLHRLDNWLGEGKKRRGKKRETQLDKSPSTNVKLNLSLNGWVNECAICYLLSCLILLFPTLISFHSNQMYTFFSTFTAPTLSFHSYLYCSVLAWLEQ